MASATPAEVLLLVDAANGFNNQSRYGMMWTVRHRCPKMFRFTFNCYCHEITLICRQPGGEIVTILSKEGVTQGDPLAMDLYGIALLPLAELLRKEFPEVLQPWFADDAAMQGAPLRVGKCFKLLTEVGSMFWYLPEPDKSFAICPLASEEGVLAAFGSEGLDVKACRGDRYIGGYVGLLEMRNRSIGPKVDSWVAAVKLSP